MWNLGEGLKERKKSRESTCQEELRPLQPAAKYSKREDDRKKKEGRRGDSTQREGER